MERELIAKIASYGDMHLGNKPYGAHRDYAKESLDYFKKITEIMEEERVTHIIGLGDLAMSKFTDLNYRNSIDELLERQYNLTNGNRWELKGNHDKSTRGMTEFEYYEKKGLIKRAENLEVGNVCITMVDYGKERETEPLIKVGKYNVIYAHNYFKFEGTDLPNYGEPIILDNFVNWFGADYIQLGHIHKRLNFKGSIVNGNRGMEVAVDYLGCPIRPSYHKNGDMDNLGFVVILEVYDDGTVQRVERAFDLWSIEESFNIEGMEEKAEHLDSVRVDISEVVEELDKHERIIGSPEEQIMGMLNIDEKYRKKAIELLREAR